MADWTDRLGEAARVLGRHRVPRHDNTARQIEHRLRRAGDTRSQDDLRAVARVADHLASLGGRVTVYTRPGGKRRFDPAQLKEGAAEELREHGKTLAKLRAGKLTVKQAAAQTAKDHLKELPDYYSRMDALEVPKPKRGLKSPRIKLLGRRGKVRIYLVESAKVRKLYGDWTMGGHDLVYPDFIPKHEVWIADEVFGVERKLCMLHELNERRLMSHGMSYDEAHDDSTALEQRYRKAKYKGLDAALRKERGQ